MGLNREDILNADDLPTREVDVPEWGGKVTVRGLNGTDRDAFEASLTVERPTPDHKGTRMVPELENMRAKLVVRAVIDDKGERIFTDRDAVALGAKSALALSRIFEVVQDLSGMSNEAAAESEGNSDAAQSGASTSD